MPCGRARGRALDLDGPGPGWPASLAAVRVTRIRRRTAVGTAGDLETGAAFSTAASRADVAGPGRACRIRIEPELVLVTPPPAGVARRPVTVGRGGRGILMIPPTGRFTDRDGCDCLRVTGLRITCSALGAACQWPLLHWHWQVTVAATVTA
jgi:hypothetical protein